MKKYEFNINNKEIVRISKALAKKLYNNGITVCFIPCNANIQSGLFGAWCNIHEYYANNTFEKMVDSFTYYNCRYGLGNYLAFYVDKQDLKKVVD